MIISCYHVVCFSLAFMCHPVVCSKQPFRAMRSPIKMYCDRDISCIVIVTYHVLISLQMVSYVVSIPCNFISLSVWHYTGNIRELLSIVKSSVGILLQNKR